MSKPTNKEEVKLTSTVVKPIIKKKKVKKPKKVVTFSICRDGSEGL
jgi:hypothetical protein